MPDIAGLKLIVPTSVAGSGVSVSASGKVTFTAATSVSVNGCFTSTYDNYLVVTRHSSDTVFTYLRGRLRLAGTDASTNYTVQYLWADSTSVTGGRSTPGYGPFGVTSDEQRSGDHVYIYGPALAQPTAWRDVNACGETSAMIYDVACTHSTATAYDGFTIYPASGNITGALTVYGLAN